ncbi:MAG: VWA-like domain-containing protein [Holophagales bacterium]|nr:VWA-like domain-containing protein [Holophagales bacterium]
MAAKRSRDRGKSKGKKLEDRSKRSVDRAVDLLRAHPLFEPLMLRAELLRSEPSLCPDDGWLVVDDVGLLHLHPNRLAAPEEWTYVLAHGLLHLGLGHFRTRLHPDLWNAACDAIVSRFLDDLKLGRRPADIARVADLPTTDENQLYDRLVEGLRLEGLFQCGTAGCRRDMQEVEAPGRWRSAPVDWTRPFAAGLRQAVASALEGAAHGDSLEGRRASRAALDARSWFMASYPLLGGLAAAFEIVENAEVCQRLDIQVAAIDDEAREVYLNPRAGLTTAELRFVMAHELLHAGLRHSARRQGRDPFLWNVACDYVINGWLVEMGVGEIPVLGLVHDPELVGLSAEAIYDRIVTDLRRYRKLSTFRGRGVGDILGRRPVDWWRSAVGMDLDAFYRESLARGFALHRDQGRGLLPAGLIEEIRALGQPPIPWDVELARWFDAHFPPLEKRRSYARSSRRQSATPEIPRPRWVAEDGGSARTFAVVLDTSGSMDRTTLAKGLGAIASYSLARDVAAVRVLFCDAAVYDQGYLPPESLGHRVEVRGRGGTVLQPALDLLDEAQDFPPKGPALIITDGSCDRLEVRREHAFLLPAGSDLPFVPKGPVFRIR